MNSDDDGKASPQQFTSYCVHSWGAGYGVSNSIARLYLLPHNYVLRISADVLQGFQVPFSCAKVGLVYRWSSSFFKYTYFIIERIPLVFFTMIF